MCDVWGALMCGGFKFFGFTVCLCSVNLLALDLEKVQQVILIPRYVWLLLLLL